MECIIGEYLKEGSCLKCDNKCLSCSNSPDNCDKCNISEENRILSSEENCRCEDGYYENEISKKCERCQNNFCKTCS